MYTTPHALSLLKGFVRNFDFSDEVLVNITSKPYKLYCKLGERRDASPTKRLLRNTERKLLNRSIAKCYCYKWKANKIVQNSINQSEDTLSIKDYCKLVMFTEKKIKFRVERKLKTLDKKYQKLINKSRPQLNDLSEEDIKVHKENTVRKPISS